MTKKTRFIEKLPNLSEAEKARAINFFNKYPVYENRIDWNKKSLSYMDFEKLFALAENSANSARRKAKTSPEIMFAKQKCKIICQTNDFLIVVPLDGACASFMNSAACGGEKTRWCTGIHSSWKFFTEKTGKIFYFIYFTAKPDVFGNKKAMLEYSFEDDVMRAWSQSNKPMNFPYYSHILEAGLHSFRGYADMLLEYFTRNNENQRFLDFVDADVENLLFLLPLLVRIFPDENKEKLDALKKLQSLLGYIYGLFLAASKNELETLDLKNIAAGGSEIYKICRRAIKGNAWIFNKIPDVLKDENLCLEAIKKRADAIRYVPERRRTQKVLTAALRQFEKNIEWIARSMCWSTEPAKSNLRDYKLVSEALRETRADIIPALLKELIDNGFPALLDTLDDFEERFGGLLDTGTN